MNELTVLGIFLTLISLLGTFFYIHLSSWFRDIIALKSKWELNEIGNKPEEEQACRECRYALRGLFNYVPLSIAIVISAFIGLVSWYSFSFLSTVEVKHSLANALCVIFTTFLIIYFLLTLYFLIHGYIIGFQISNRIMKKFPKPPEQKKGT